MLLVCSQWCILSPSDCVHVQCTVTCLSEQCNCVCGAFIMSAVIVDIICCSVRTGDKGIICVSMHNYV